jgi:amino acid adenylation domain-containing protein
LTPRTIGEQLQAAAAARPDGVAVRAQGAEITYAELDRAAERLAAGLRGRGVERGARVMVQLGNGIDMCVAIYGLARAGAAFVPVNPTTKPAKLADELARAGAIAMLCDAEHAGTARDAADLHGGGLEPLGVEAASGSGAAPGEALDGDLAAIMFTSGSTGEPKGVMLSHQNVVFATDSIVEYLELGPEDRVLSVLPLSFGYGLSQLLTCVRAGATLVLEPGLGLPGRLVRLLEEERITGMPAVPTAFAVLTRLRGLAERELPHLRFLTNAGAGLSEPGLEAVRRTFPDADLYCMYGQTECTRVCYLPPAELDARAGSVGVAIPGTEAWVERADGTRAAPGETGELMVRGTHVMQGYWQDPERTAGKLRPGRWPWERVLATGDLFRADADGRLWFLSRSDDIIKSRGEKVAPKEVEDVLYGVAGVAEAAVVGVPDELLGQAVHAHVVLEDAAAVTPDELRRRCAERLEDHMVPQQVRIHPALPRTPNGKLDRRALAAGAPAT